ncbi:MAG TPA: response regulator [Calditrichaeota bacterium]|nr:response regulator [Calditrichota bacterium]
MNKDKKNKTILFVDDEPALVKMNIIFLQRHGYSVKGTVYAGEALNWFKADPKAFNLVITDIAMPEMNGEEMIRKLRMIYPGVKIIVLSGTIHTRQTDRSNHIIYLDKPVEPEKLLEQIHLLIG